MFPTKEIYFWYIRKNFKHKQVDTGIIVESQNRKYQRSRPQIPEVLR